MRVHVPEFASAWSLWYGHSALAPWKLQILYPSPQEAETLGTVLLPRSTVWRYCLEGYKFFRVCLIMYMEACKSVVPVDKLGYLLGT